MPPDAGRGIAAFSSGRFIGRIRDVPAGVRGCGFTSIQPVQAAASRPGVAYNLGMADPTGNPTDPTPDDPAPMPNRQEQNGVSSPGGDLISPLFPLPNVVLFPGAVLPLHIFEERYKAMTRDALAGDRRIAMALLCPGWEKTYHGRPEIEPVVCVGTILSSERLPDGNYNFLLQGTCRASISKEIVGAPYRIAKLEPLRERPSVPEFLDAQRERMVGLFTAGPLSQTSMGRQFAKLVAASPKVPTDRLADLIAFNFIDNAALKQHLLAEPDVHRRVSITLDAVEALCPCVPSASVRAYRNPSTN